eukprot:403365677
MSLRSNLITRDDSKSKDLKFCLYAPLTRRMKRLSQNIQPYTPKTHSLIKVSIREDERTLIWYGPIISRFQDNLVFGMRRRDVSKIFLISTCQIQDPHTLLIIIGINNQINNRLA